LSYCSLDKQASARLPFFFFCSFKMSSSRFKKNYPLRSLYEIGL
jgi:hypothetical protein